MQAPVSPEEGDILSWFEKCIRQGDWDAVARLTDQIGRELLPPGLSQYELGERLRRLQTALVAARVARAGLAVSLSRVRAAASFMESRAVH